MPERICAICGRANPKDMPRCMNCGQRVQGVVLVAEETPPTITPWWTGASARPGSIPPPPQVREEVARAEAAQLDRAKRDAERERRLAAAQEREERIRTDRSERAKAALDAISAANPTPRTNQNVTSAPTPMALKAECERCGTPLKTAASGQGFSFCLHCGAEAPPSTVVTPAMPVAAAFGSPVLGGAAQASTSQSAAQTSSQGKTVALAGTVAVAERQTVGVSPGLAAVLSFFLPGLGQLVNGQISKGALLFLASFVLATIWHVPLFLLLIGRVLAAVDAHHIAARRRTGGPVSDGEWDLG